MKRQAVKAADHKKADKAVIRDITSEEMIQQLRDEKQRPQLIHIVRQLLKDE